MLRRGPGESWFIYLLMRGTHSSRAPRSAAPHRGAGGENAPLSHTHRYRQPAGEGGGDMGPTNKRQLPMHLDKVGIDKRCDARLKKMTCTCMYVRRDVCQCSQCVPARPSDGLKRTGNTGWAFLSFFVPRVVLKRAFTPLNRRRHTESTLTVPVCTTRRPTYMLLTNGLL